jgi:hypothetical protein
MVVVCRVLKHKSSLAANGWSGVNLVLHVHVTLSYEILTPRGLVIQYCMAMWKKKQKSK